jgi:hypothetical protein
MRPVLAALLVLATAPVAYAQTDAPAAGGPAAAPEATATPVAATSCLKCHADADMVGEDLAKIVPAFEHDVHRQAGLSCQDCHGGNPDPAVADDPDAAMDPHFRSHPFVGAPDRTQIPGFCGRCHSDPDFMRRYRPGLRVDQEKEYWTSRHGQALRHGDTKVATCVDCHGTHGILSPKDPASPVYPTHVAETCRACHGSAEHMAGYRRDDGSPLPIDQYALWRQSVHAQALLDKGDLSAPTCNDCHGNHGAVPPGLDSIAYVCGQCHGRESELFRASPKVKLFAAHNEMLKDAGPQACAACHDAPEPAASVRGIHTFSECVTCHGNHAVIRPSVAMLGPLPDTPCAFCHQKPEQLTGSFTEPAAVSTHFAAVRGELLGRVPPELDADGRFDWLVDRALELPFHNEVDENGKQTLRPEFARLFEKFRIGKRHFTYEDPATGKPVVGRVRSCGDCHAPASASSAGGEGAASGGATAAAFLDGMWGLTSVTARSERILLRAHQGGVQTKAAQAAIDQAVDDQIQLEVLVHTFSAAPDGTFAKRQKQGLEQAQKAYTSGVTALGEVAARRRGLVIFLVLVVLLVVAIGLKIRSLPPAGDRG